MEINIYYCVFSNSIYKYVKFKLINNLKNNIHFLNVYILIIYKFFKEFTLIIFIYKNKK